MSLEILENIGEKAALKLKKIHKIGIICEDNSDFDALCVLIARITTKDNLSFKRRIGDGCGKLRRKCLAWSNELDRSGCDMLIVVHDKDDNIYNTLLSELEKILETSDFKNRYICIPTEELEAWLLSDPTSVKNTMKLDRTPRVTGDIESIRSPKEKLGQLVKSCSNGRVTYINTVHNKKLAMNASTEIMAAKCTSFRSFRDHIAGQSYI